MNAASQKPALVIQGFLKELKNTKSRAKAAKTPVYLLSPDKPKRAPMISQFPKLN